MALSFKGILAVARRWALRGSGVGALHPAAGRGRGGIGRQDRWPDRAAYQRQLRFWAELAGRHGPGLPVFPQAPSLLLTRPHQSAGTLRGALADWR